METREKLYVCLLQIFEQLFDYKRKKIFDSVEMIENIF